MVASFLAACFFALNATCATHSVRAQGPLRANLGRLVVAAVVLGAFAHTLGGGFASASVGWFLLSGVIGMGFGDLGVYGALPFLGSRLTVLMTQCLAAPLAALGEWLWLGTRLTPAQTLWGAVILAGVAVALMPGKSTPPRVRVRPVGFLFGLLAAAGQGFGALVSRRGVQAAEQAGETAHNAIFGLTAAYQRIIAGLVFIALWLLVLRLLGRLPPPPRSVAISCALAGTRTDRPTASDAGPAPGDPSRPPDAPGECHVINDTSSDAASTMGRAGDGEVGGRGAGDAAGGSARRDGPIAAAGKRGEEFSGSSQAGDARGARDRDYARDQGRSRDLRDSQKRSGARDESSAAARETAAADAAHSTTVAPTAPELAPERRQARLWMLANGLAGPVLGVGCYQWALATTPSGIVLPIAATTPLLAIPIAHLLEGDRPSKRSIAGGVLAVAGCIALTLSR